MKNRTYIVSTILVLALSSLADAQPRRADGGACGSTGTARKTGTDDLGNKLDCLWDTCTYNECNGSGTHITCVTKTEYSNARDCKAAAARPGIKGTKNPGLKNGAKLLKQ